MPSRKEMTSPPFFLIDSNLDLKHDFFQSKLCELVNDVLYPDASDFEVGTYAVEHNRIILTNDKKFTLSLLLNHQKVGYVKQGKSFDSIDFLYPAINAKLKELQKPNILKLLLM